MVNIMDGPLKDGVGQALVYPRAGAGGKRRRSFGKRAPWTQGVLAAITSRQIAVAVTLAGAVAVIVFHVFYAVVIQGWGSPLP